MMLIDIDHCVDTNNCPLKSSKSVNTLLRVGLAYEQVTRWSDEVFAPGQTLQNVKDDIG